MNNVIFPMDSMFPQFHQGQSTDEKLNAILDYLMQLQEQLRYTLANLGKDNFNETELNELGREIVSAASIQSVSSVGVGVIMEEGELRFVEIKKGSTGGYFATIGITDDGGLGILSVNGGPVSITASGDLALRSENGNAIVEGERIDLNGEIYINGQLYNG